MIGHWSDDIENMLIKIRLNSILRSKYHKQSYFRMNSMLKYFRIPIIILSALLSVFSMSTFYLQKYICSSMSIIISIISSIEMFLQIQKRMEIDLHNSRSFSTLSAEITKVLNLDRENRNIDGLKFLDDRMNEYNSLVDMSIVTDIKLHEKLLGLNLLTEISKDDEIKLLTNSNNSIRDILSYKGPMLSLNSNSINDDIESRLSTGQTRSSTQSQKNVGLGIEKITQMMEQAETSGIRTMDILNLRRRISINDTEEPMTIDQIKNSPIKKNVRTEKDNIIIGTTGTNC